MTSVGTGALIFSADGQRLLLLRYKKNGEWGRPGGRVDAGETARAACIREVKEEVALDFAATPELDQRLSLVDWCEGASLAPTPVVGWVAAGFAITLPDASLEALAVRLEEDKHDGMAWVPVATVLAAAASSGVGTDAPAAAAAADSPVAVEELRGHLNPFTAASLQTVLKNRSSPHTF